MYFTLIPAKYKVSKNNFYTYFNLSYTNYNLNTDQKCTSDITDIAKLQNSIHMVAMLEAKPTIMTSTHLEWK